MPYVDLPGVHLWYTDAGGTGVPVILMHAPQAPARAGCSSSRCSRRPATGVFPMIDGVGVAHVLTRQGSSPAP
jgi:hypothetical protein